MHGPGVGSDVDIAGMINALDSATAHFRGRPSQQQPGLIKWWPGQEPTGWHDAGRRRWACLSNHVAGLKPGGAAPPPWPLTRCHPRSPALRCLCSDLYNNALFGSGAATSPSQAGEDSNPMFSPAAVGGGACTGGGAPPGSAVGMRRLGFMPQSQLRNQGTGQYNQTSPGGDSDEAMGEEGGDAAAQQQPPAASLAGGASPGALASGSSSGRERPEEDEFAGVLGAVMRGEADAAEAVREYAAICRQRSAALRELASTQLQRAAR